MSNARELSQVPNQSLSFKNRLINGGFSVAQRGTSFTSTSSANNDDTYNLDRWYVLSDGNDAVDITQATDVPTDAKYSIGLDVETINKKFGIAQIIENINCYDLQDKTVTVSFKAKVSATTKLDNVKCAIVSWTGTVDSVTSDIISAWGSEGTNPTLITNATYENTPANLNVTTSWATYSVSAAIDTASIKNIIVFIWSDVTDTTLGDFLYITNVQLEVGSTATSFDYRPTELALCQRYYRIIGQGAISVARATTQVVHGSSYQDMRAAPTAALLTTSPVFYNFATAANTTGSSSTINDSSLGVAAAQVNLTGFSGLTAGQSMSAVTTAITSLSAEL